MTYIGIKSYSHLVNLNERTIRRHIEAKALTSYYDKALNRTFITLDDLLKNSSIPLGEELDLIRDAEQGEAVSQADIGVLFLEHNKPAEAIYWLQLAVKQGYSDAMALLADCYARGVGVKKDDNQAILWASKAASAGSLIAQQQINGIIAKL